MSRDMLNPWVLRAGAASGEGLAAWIIWDESTGLETGFPDPSPEKAALLFLRDGALSGVPSLQH